MSYEEQIMSKDKYPSIFFAPIGGYCVNFIILHIIFAMQAVLKIGGHPQIFPGFSWGIFGHVTCLDQSHGSEKFLMDYNSTYLHLGWLVPSQGWKTDCST